MARANKKETTIPNYEIEALARCLLPDIQAYFESKDGKREFASWKKKREKEKQGKRPKP